MDARGKFGEHKRSVRVARGSTESNYSSLSAFQTAQGHSKLDICTAKSMNQFFYNMATTAWALKHVLILIDYNKLSRCTVKENKSPYYLNTTKSVSNLAMENSLLSINYNENVGKQSKNVQ